nr:integrase, catalytic region, zinc finger, CCHC-type, peptidase aspartic, catalytic [Tanacetum cinerariifolium]
MIIESVEHGLLIWLTIKENRVTRTKKYIELFAAEKIQADCNMKATNIILQGLPSDIYSLVNHHRVSKDLWERIQLLTQGTSLIKQERECKLYDTFDKFAHIKRELLHQYNLRFTHLINDMNIYNMKLEQFQVNTKFLNSLPPEWSKFMTDGHNATSSGETIIQVDRQGLLNATTVKVKDIWLGNAISLSDQGVQYDAGVLDGQAVHTIIPNNDDFQTEDLDTYDSSCDDISNAKAVLMTNISNYSFDVISEIMRCIVTEMSFYTLNICKKHNRLTDDFRKRFTPQQELSAEQANWLRMFDPTSIPSDALPVKIEAPKELSKISLVNESLKKIKFHLTKFDNMDGNRKESCNLVAELLKSQNAFNDLLKNKDITICKLKDIIKSLREKYKGENISYNYGETETKNVELENSVAKLSLENERLCNEINHMKQVFKEQFESIKKTRVRTKEHSDSLIDKLNLKSAENEDLNAQIQDKGIVGQAKAKQPLDNALDFACKHAQRIQELLVYVRDTCPNAINLSAKKVVVTPKNKVKKVRFVEPLTSSSDIKQVESSKTSDSNTPVLSPTGLKCSTSNYGSKPTSNKMNDRISQTPSMNMKNKVEAQPRNVNKKNRVVEPIRNVDVKQSQLNANFELNCATCKKSMFDGIIQIVLWYLDSRCSKHMTRNRSQLMNFVSKLLGTVRFGNDHITRIMVYGDYQLGNVTISKVYYVEGLGHNLFSVGQFCDADLEVAFRKDTCFIRNLEGVDLISRSRDTNLYTISLDDMLKTSLICLLSKASKTKSWLWHRRLSHLNFGTLNKLTKDGLARGILRLSRKIICVQHVH